jgi:hypothetical protein
MDQGVGETMTADAYEAAYAKRSTSASNILPKGARYRTVRPQPAVQP